VACNYLSFFAFSRFWQLYCNIFLELEKVDICKSDVLLDGEF